MGVPTRRHCKSMNGVFGFLFVVLNTSYLGGGESYVKNAIVNHTIYLNATNSYGFFVVFICQNVGFWIDV